MIVFAVCCMLLIVLALASVLPPLRRPHEGAVASGAAEANLAVYRRQFAEIESDLRDRIMTNEEYLSARQELEERVVAEIPRPLRASQAARTSSNSRALVAWLALGLPLAAILLYLALGSPSHVLQSP